MFILSYSIEALLRRAPRNYAGRGFTLGDAKIAPVSLPPHSRSDSDDLFLDFVSFLQEKQSSIISAIESLENGSKFSRDTWGLFADNSDALQKSGGITRVLQGGDVIEKGACSLTWIQHGSLSAERAATIRARQIDGVTIAAGDVYSAAALSIVFHTKSPLVPTFRSDVRVFKILSTSGESIAWFGGGADLTPYYLFDDDIVEFHSKYRDLCNKHLTNDPEFSYESMKEACDSYFYLPARSEHRGTGGIFFDDMLVTEKTLAFVKGVADTWMQSWIPIVERRRATEYSEQQKHWQLLRRGRYLEFNLLYDRGVKFGLANANPRVEGVMVSAPPVIAFEYNHKVADGSPEERLLRILKSPIDWVGMGD